MTTVQQLNKWLFDNYKVIDKDLPLYRIVWSDSLFEMRYGTFVDKSESGLIFLREVTETRRVRKYTYINERWIFEKWAPGNLTACRETPESINGDYIPVYVFEDSNRNYLPPTEKSIRFIIQVMEGQVRKDDPLDYRYFEDKEVKEFEESMDTHPMFSTHGETRDSVAYTGSLKKVHDFKE